ncbi:hypothetical protein CPB83DRAFT_845100 [Crepidotus variabilis]|uniref:AN1-type domain-containing protein n=1 Tax=Crepidotus variabilis TaxID=179855 RepID=A0A9P6ER41_9AGAR|nr:hypothetical protein CPB83DRAFT_845100 [Crepidotus variabilis]
MASDIPHVGAHCAVASCNILDFLPITCQCNQKFCSDHITPNSHDCDTILKADLAQTTFADKIHRCTVVGCGKLSLNGPNGAANETCPFCRYALCATHRHQDAHKCLEDEPQAHRNVSTKITTLIKPSTKGVRYRKPPTDPAKLAQWQRVELLKMQHAAIPVDPRDQDKAVPLDQRVHAVVAGDEVEKAFWFRKTLVAGKAIDLLCLQLGLNSTDDTRILLIKTSINGDQTTLRNNLPVAEQIENGCTLKMERCAKETE